jgi:hypothetical protein
MQRMKLLRDYLLRIVFAVGILLGIQAPNFVAQYAQRVEAHYLEAKQNFSGFQATADRYFGGDVTALIAKHEASDDEVFRAEADPIRDTYNRLQQHKAEMVALDTHLASQLLHVAQRAQSEIFTETVAGYSAMVPLNVAAIACGIGVGVALTILLELLLLLLRAPWLIAARRSNRFSHP